MSELTKLSIGNTPAIKSSTTTGFLRGAWELFQDVTSLGGSYRVRSAQEEHEVERLRYEAISDQLSTLKDSVAQHISSIGQHIDRAHSLVMEANRIMSPFGDYQRFRRTASASTAFIEERLGSRIREFDSDYHNALSTVSGAVLGGASSVGLWGAVQLIGHASTGAAMAGLHGAAAASAGWAWFGGGSLAAGGGGMALGHVVLPGVGTAVAIACSSFISHNQANKLQEEIASLRAANDKNAATLTQNRNVGKAYSDAEQKVRRKVDSLEFLLDACRRALFPFGSLSKVWRFLRFFFTGRYYADSERGALKDLERAVEDFLRDFQRP